MFKFEGILENLENLIIRIYSFESNYNGQKHVSIVFLELQFLKLIGINVIGNDVSLQE